MVWPCLYTALTTIIGFGSLVFSGIKPVIDFGWMMSIGLAVTFVTAFTLFPGRRAPARSRRRGGAGGRRSSGSPAGSGAASPSPRSGTAALVLAAAVAAAGRSARSGVSRLTVENSFVDYFSEDTEIYQGTRAHRSRARRHPRRSRSCSIWTKTGSSTTSRPRNRRSVRRRKPSARRPVYWFTEFKIERIKEVHDWLASQPEVGKVLSLASLVRVGERLNDGEPLDSLQLALVYRRVPEALKRSLIRPLRRHPVGRGADLAPHPRQTAARPAPQGAARPDPRGSARRARARLGRTSP